MRKSRVLLRDADGRLHEVVGYADARGALRSGPGFAGGGGSGWYLRAPGSPVIPVVELPTGLGAVVEVDYGPPINDSERFIRVDDDWWYPTGVLDPVKDSFFDTVSFTVLSEGVPGV